VGRGDTEHRKDRTRPFIATKGFGLGLGTVTLCCFLNLSTPNPTHFSDFIRVLVMFMGL
jgi:hypothetical protein